MKHAKIIGAFISLFFAVVAGSTSLYAQAWPAGKITNTVTTREGNCEQYQDAASIATYSNWNYRDSSGVTTHLPVQPSRWSASPRSAPEMSTPPRR